MSNTYQKIIPLQEYHLQGGWTVRFQDRGRVRIATLLTLILGRCNDSGRFPRAVTKDAAEAPAHVSCGADLNVAGFFFGGNRALV